MKQEFTRIAVKVGSNVLTRRDGTLDVTRMSALVDQIAELHKTGVEVILISSGAVASSPMPPNGAVLAAPVSGLFQLTIPARASSNS